MDGADLNEATTAQATRLRLQCFGVFDARWTDGRKLRLSSLKARALLAYLALSPDMRRTREHLAALLWDRSDHEHARASLRQAVAALRKALGPAHEIALLADDPETLALNPGVIDLDFSPPAGGDRTDFLASLNIRSEPFEDWRREQAALYDEPDAAPQRRPEQASPAEQSVPGPSRALRFAAIAAAAGVIVVAAAAMIPRPAATTDATTDTMTDRATPPPNSQNATERALRAAALGAYPHLENAIGACKFDHYDPAATIAACSDVIDALPYDAPYKAVALAMRGTARRWDGDHEAARADFAEALVIDPDYYNAHHGIAYTYFLMQRYDRALHHYARVKALAPNHVMAHYRTGEVYSALGDHANAVAAYTQTIALNPDSAYAYYFRAKSRIALGETKAARDDLRMAASLSSTLRTEAQAIYAALDEDG